MDISRLKYLKKLADAMATVRWMRNWLGDSPDDLTWAELQKKIYSEMIVIRDELLLNAEEEFIELKEVSKKKVTTSPTRLSKKKKLNDGCLECNHNENGDSPQSLLSSPSDE